MLPSEKTQPDSRPSASSERAAPYVIAILLLPALVLWRRDDALFSPLWQSDPWFYLGYFRDLVNFKRDLFYDFYFGSRLSWLLPGYLIHSLFPPIVANAVLHLTVHSVAVLSLFSILRLTIGLRSAYLSAMIFSLHPWLWSATGWDHPNGGAIAYYLLAMALLTRAALRPVKKGGLMLAGAAIAGSVYTHFFLLVFVPLLLLYYVALTWVWNRKPQIGALLGPGLWWLSSGFAFVTLSLCVINYLWIDGNFWFWSPSIVAARNVTQSYAWTESIWSDGKLVPWMWFVVAASATAIFLLPSHLRGARRGSHAIGLLFSVQLLLATSIMAYFQGRGITLLGHWYYACYLLPFVFLVIGASFWPAVEKMRSRAYLITCCIATLLFGSLWYDPGANPVSSGRIPEWAEVLMGGSILAMALVLRQRKIGTLLALAGLAIFTSVIYTGSYRLADLHGTHDAYMRIMTARQHIEDRRNGGPVMFWYDKQESAFLEYYALDCTYLADAESPNRIGERFPQDCTSPADPNALIVVTSQKEHTAELARSALTDCWQKFGMNPTIRDVEIVQGPGRSYEMAILQADAGASLNPPPGEIVKAIALERVKLGATHARLDLLPEGLIVTTIPGYGSYAGRINLGLDANVPPGLAVLVQARVLQGRIWVGILDPSGKVFLVQRPLTPSPNASRIVLLLPNVPVIGDLIISNGVPSNNGISKAIIDKIEIRKVP